jgi:hypothetical protein
VALGGGGKGKKNDRTLIILKYILWVEDITICIISCLIMGG